MDQSLTNSKAEGSQVRRSTCMGSANREKYDCLGSCRRRKWDSHVASLTLFMFDECNNHVMLSLHSTAKMKYPKGPSRRLSKAMKD